VRIDQSSKIPATTFLRALDKKYSTTEAIIREFYPVEKVKVADLQAAHYAVNAIIDTESGEELVKAGAQIAESLGKVQASGLKSIEANTRANAPLPQTPVAKDAPKPQGAPLLKFTPRLRPGNPPQLDKAETLFEEKFFDENRYRLGRVGRFRINRKFDQ